MHVSFVFRLAPAFLPFLFAGACLLVAMVAVVLAVTGWRRRVMDTKQGY